MANNDLELDTDDFQMPEPPKAVGKASTEKIEEKVDKVNNDGTVGHVKLEKEVVDNLDSQVENLIKEIASAPIQSKEMKQITDTLEKMGDSEINKTSNISNRLLERPLRSLRNSKEAEGDNIASSLKKLRGKVQDLDPSKRDNLNTKDTIFGIPIPFRLGRKVDNFVQEYKSAESQLKDITEALNNGKDQLMEDNAYIEEERSNLIELLTNLEQYAYVMKKLDKRIAEKLPEIEASEPLKAADIKAEILYPIREKRQDLLKHMAVCLQGYMGLQVIEQNNKALIRGVNRTIKTTLQSLRYSVIMATSLQNQNDVLQQVIATDEIGNTLMKQNGEVIEKQGLAIQQKLTNLGPDPEVVKQTMMKILGALDAVDNYRQEALPKMEQTIAALEDTIRDTKAHMNQKRQENTQQFMQEVLDETRQENNSSGGQKAVKIKM